MILESGHFALLSSLGRLRVGLYAEAGREAGLQVCGGCETARSVEDHHFCSSRPLLPVTVAMAHSGGYNYAVWVRCWICVGLVIGVQLCDPEQAKCETSRAKCEKITIPSPPRPVCMVGGCVGFGRLTLLLCYAPGVPRFSDSDDISPSHWMTSRSIKNATPFV